MKKKNIDFPMSRIFEEEIQNWYLHSRRANLEYLDLSEVSKPQLSELGHNQAVTFDRLSLFANSSFKNFKNLQNHSKGLSEKLEILEETVRKNQSETIKSLQQISSEIQDHRPLTEREVLNLVQEISKQPKLAEEEALKLTTELKSRIYQVEQQLQKVEHLLKEVQRGLGY